MSGEKKYGLIIPARKKAGAAAGGRPIAKPSVFGDSSSDEEVCMVTWYIIMEITC